MSTYEHIAQRAGQVPVRQLCQVLRVAPAAYYAWQRRRQRPAVEPGWQVAVRQAFADHSLRYGTRRLRAVVQAQGHAVGRWRIRRVLKTHGLRAQQPRLTSSQLLSRLKVEHQAYLTCTHFLGRPKVEHQAF